MTMKRLLMTAVVVGAFAAGAGAQRVVNGVNMRGRVMDANTIAEPVEYWEIRSSTGESVVITGRNNLPMIKWLRQYKNRPVELTLEPSPDSQVPADAERGR
jgi:hypothetical protein